MRANARFGSLRVATIVVAMSAIASCFLGVSKLIMLASGFGIAQGVLLN